MKKKLGTILGIILAALVVGLLVYDHSHPRHFSNLAIMDTTDNAFSTQISQNRNHQLNYVFVYKPGCPDCQHVEKSLIQPLNKLQHQHRLIMINANNKRTLKYLHANEVTHTPTVIVKYHNYTVFMYSGRNIETFQKLLKGLNPQTDYAFKLKAPTSTHIQNDFTHTNESEPTQRINSATIQTTFDN